MLFKREASISRDEGAIDDFLTRGVSAVYPDISAVKQMFQKGGRLSMYLGIDPTGPTLHLGHAIALRKLRAFQNLGHKVILLIGSFTAQIGDPTDKLAARTRLTEREVLENAKLYKKQAAAILDFGGSNPAELKYNGEWLSKLTFADVVELAAKTTVQEMLKRDMFETRLKEEKPIYLHEFLYPLMQGYDSVAMKVDGEIGGNDQLFNMLVGRDLVRAYLGKEKFVMTMKLLTDQSGKKMGKTEGNMAALSDSPEEVFGKVMSWTDGMILSGFELCTDVPTSELPTIEQEMTSGNPRDLKLKLATQVVQDHFGQEAATRAREHFLKTFSNKEIPENIPTVSASHVSSMLGFVVAVTGESKSASMRLFEQGAVRKENGEKVTDPHAPPVVGKYRIGTRKFGEIVE